MWGNIIASGTTDANGNRGSSGLGAGNYSVGETQQAGWTNTTPVCLDVTLSAGQNAVVFFGNVQPPQFGSITAHKFQDTNSNFVQDVGEPSLSGWAMTLYSGSNCTGTVLTSGTTDVNGNRLFSNLTAGSYSVGETQQTGWTNTTATCVNETITPNENATVNFGNVQVPDTGSITAHKFQDTNSNGVQDVGEPNLASWTMTLYSGSNCTGAVLAQGTTDANGNEVFSGLTAGSYSVGESAQTGWTNITPSCINETLTAGENATINFANVQLPTVIPVPLFPGWNNVEWMPNVCKPIREAVANLTSPTDVLEVVGFWVASGQFFLLFDDDAPDAVNDLEQLCPGDIVWVYVTTSIIWLLDP